MRYIVPQTNAAAGWTLVLGILGLVVPMVAGFLALTVSPVASGLLIFQPVALAAIILGVSARRRLRERGEAGDRMAVAGIVLGAIGTALLYFVLFSAFLASALLGPGA
jgi:hypothetical protein